MVDIKPWDSMPDLDDVSDCDRRAAATACFAALTTGTRRRNHAVFLISNDLSSGILYTYHKRCGVRAISAVASGYGCVVLVEGSVSVIISKKHFALARLRLFD